MQELPAGPDHPKPSPREAQAAELRSSSDSKEPAARGGSAGSVLRSLRVRRSLSARQSCSAGARPCAADAGYAARQRKAQTW